MLSPAKLNGMMSAGRLLGGHFRYSIGNESENRLVEQVIAVGKSS